MYECLNQIFKYFETTEIRQKNNVNPRIPMTIVQIYYMDKYTCGVVLKFLIFRYKYRIIFLKFSSVLRFGIGIMSEFMAKLTIFVLLSTIFMGTIVCHEFDLAGICQERAGKTDAQLQQSDSESDKFEACQNGLYVNYYITIALNLYEKINNNLTKLIII